MSFTPTIIINYDELLEKRSELEAIVNDETNDEDIIEACKTLLEYLRLAQEYGCVKFPKHKLNLILIDSDLTSRNSDIREELFDLGIEYEISN